MPYVTSIERAGIRKGKAEGHQEGTISVILPLLKRRFGELEPELEQGINALSLKQLEELSEALLDFSNVAEVGAWLAERKT